MKIETRITDLNIQKPVPNNKKTANTANSSRFIEGRIMDKEENLPLRGVYVTIKNTHYSTVSDRNGRFKIAIPENFKGKNILLKFSLPEYESKQISYSTGKLPLKIQVKLQAEPMIMGIIIDEPDMKSE